jgi:FtsH-binding integral membrane protein
MNSSYLLIIISCLLTLIDNNKIENEIIVDLGILP